MGSIEIFQEKQSRTRWYYGVKRLLSTGVAILIGNNLSHSSDFGGGILEVGVLLVLLSRVEVAELDKRCGLQLLIPLGCGFNGSS